MLEERIKTGAIKAGADKVGTAKIERLSDAPPSGDATDVLESARSVVSFAVALDPEITREYLSKREWLRDSGASDGVVI